MFYYNGGLGPLFILHTLLQVLLKLSQPLRSFNETEVLHMLLKPSPVLDPHLLFCQIFTVLHI